MMQERVLKSQFTGFREGSFYLIPLEQHGYAVALITRLHGRAKTSMLCYFFRPVIHDAAPETALAVIRQRAILDVARSGTQALKSREWPVLGFLDGFRREDWPVPLVRDTGGWITEHDQDEFTRSINGYWASGKEHAYEDCTYGVNALRFSIGIKLGVYQIGQPGA